MIAAVLSDLILLDAARHFEALELLSVQKLAGGDLAEAFRFADRRCRISPMAKAYHYALRGEISYRMGCSDAACADIAQALELAPDDLAANRRMLAWGEGEAQIRAAQRLIAVEHDFAGIASALAVARRAGKSDFAAIEWNDAAVSGWAVWDRRKRAKLTISGDDGEVCVTLPADPDHPLATDAASAASFAVDRPLSSKPQRVLLQAGNTTFHQARMRANAGTASSDHKRNPAARRAPADAPLNVIVPVYADFAATKACLDSLMRELARRRTTRLILIDDDSKDPSIKRLVRALARKPQVRLLTNKHNLGFAESVNRGLAESGRGDVILLNADTIVPPGFIGRLEAAARRETKIGTITPLSNNGELTSFPVPFRSNPLGSYDEVCALDAAAAKANAGRVIDMPNGIGFCLYVTRACLNAVGALSDAFRRGYFEDVDLCLRAAELGFRNVCAADVYVGHAGSRSFGTEKRSLVVQNLETIEQWFPKYRAECAAFLEADPLRPARQAVERAMVKRYAGAILLVTGPGPIRSIVEARARSLASNDAKAVIAEIRCSTGRGPVVSLVNSAKNMPQSLAFTLATSAERAAAIDYLRRLRPTRIEIADPAKIPPVFVHVLQQLKLPIDLLVADGGLLCRHGSFIRHDGSACRALMAGRTCDECLTRTTAATPSCAETAKDRSPAWAKIVECAQRIYACGPRGRAFAGRITGRRDIIECGDPQRASSRSGSYGPSIGFVPVGTGLAEYQLMKAVAQSLGRKQPERSCVVIGETIDDLGLMKLDNVFVTGPVEVGEFERVLRQYGVGALFVPSRQPLFGHPKIGAIASLAPTAAFDWSFGGIPPEAGDLALSPDLPSDEVSNALVSWMARI